MAKLLHHGAAASSSAHTVLWIKDEDTSHIVYSSHGIINICQKCIPEVHPEEPVWSVMTTLRSSSVGSNSNSTAMKRVITSLCTIRNSATQSVVGLTSGFSDGTVVLWHKQDQESWTEQVLPTSDAAATAIAPSITDMDGIQTKSGDIMLVVCSSIGVVLFRTSPTATSCTTIATFAANTVRLQPLHSSILLLIGTAAPRHNKIHVYHFCDGNTARHVGHLLGHEDWLTDFAWHTTTKDSNLMLASASQDAKIRLWQFETSVVTPDGEATATVATADNNEFDDDDAIDDDDEEENGEARLEWQHTSDVSDTVLATRVVLEAMLYGHEEAVTSVAWHPQPQTVYKQDAVLLSSSMDRTLLIWACIDVWTPIQRVGAAGGILGGSIGSTLLGFVGVHVEPQFGTSLVGHAYGGALHVWTLEEQQVDAEKEEEEVVSTEELALRNHWNATPCITGHFDGVTDCCWEASTGDYLLTVSNDQTCRLWGPIATTGTTQDIIWVELARPQVHGYNLTTLTSISTTQRRHTIVTGADEKEIRVFDAPRNALTLLQQVMVQESSSSTSTPEDDGLERVDRAYIPSLGLSNKASATDGAQEDTEGIRSGDEDDEQIHLPLERDLGAVSLWPEVGKLYSHNTELYCLTSTVTAQSGLQVLDDGPFANDVLVASSAKARDLKDAAIRIWNVESGKCVQVLAGGHKSTVASLAFSPDGRYLASSGKDRRLCIWSCQATSEPKEVVFTLGAAIDSAHKRIVWSVHFCPFDSTLLATGSRDGTVKIWRIGDASTSENGSLSATVLHTFEASYRNEGKKGEAVTAVSFAPIPSTLDSNEAILAVGLDNGLIEMWGVSDKECHLLHAIEPPSCHFTTVKKLSWRPVRKADAATLILASASADHGCRLYSFDPVN
jgi:elongator complex protein 2